MTSRTINRRIVIVEPNSSGHHFYYVRLLAERALQKSQDCEVVLLTTEASRNSREYQIHLARISKLKTTCLSSDDFRLSNLSSNPLVRDSAQVSFPESDKLLFQIALGHWKISAPTTFLVMRPDGEPRKIKGLGYLVGLSKKFLIIASNLRSNIKVYGLKSPISKRKAPIPWLSDPITLNTIEGKIEEYRSILDELAPRFWIGVFGYITPRKNLNLVIGSISNRKDIGLVIAGTLDNEVQESLKFQLQSMKDEHRLFVISGPLDDSSLDSAIAAVDIVVAAHSNGGPSGIVAKAASLGKPLALAGAKSLRTDSKNLGTQARWTKLDANRISVSVDVLSKSGPFKSVRYDSGQDFSRKLLP